MLKFFDILVWLDELSVDISNKEIGISNNKSNLNWFIFLGVQSGCFEVNANKTSIAINRECHAMIGSQNTEEKHKEVDSSFFPRNRYYDH